MILQVQTENGGARLRTNGAVWWLLICGICAGAGHASFVSAQDLTVNHAEIIRSWDEQSLDRGQRIYNAICISCHGNLEIEGSLPTSRKFWEAEFKNGRDPYSLYRTLSQGFEQMPPQPWMTPEMRYDVIHYIREAFVRTRNRAQYFEVTPDYLDGLPKTTEDAGMVAKAQHELEAGPKYLRMNFGPVMFGTYEIEPGNIAYKGIAARLDAGAGGISKGRTWTVFDHDTMRVAAGWTGSGFINWRGIAFDGAHGTHPAITGSLAFSNPPGPGWAHPVTGRVSDPRLRGRDGKPYGPLPRDWALYKGVYLRSNDVVIAYSVGDCEILEKHSLEGSGATLAFARTLNLGRSSTDLLMRAASQEAAVLVVGESPAELAQKEGAQWIRIPREATPLKLKVLISDADPGILYSLGLISEPAADLSAWTQGGPARWPGAIVTQGVQAWNEAPFAVDVLTVPEDHANPWKAWMRLTGLDFIDDRTLAACTWMGDVWTVSGIGGEVDELVWRRIAAGLFQPLGLKIVKGRIYVACRDQIVELDDLDGDGEFDFYRSFNNDHQVTEHFHEFAMGLQADAGGNFYYAKSARHALPAIVPHHGTLLKVSADGTRTEILATGFRAANGVCLNPDGSFWVTDQEGHWIPKNRINRVRPGGFYGNMMGYHAVSDASDAAMEQPLCWITNGFDRSPGELLWVTSEAWAPLTGGLIEMSYGTGHIFLVLRDDVNGVEQGGMVRLPIPEFPTGVMRGRFHPGDGQLYACGMHAWAGNQQQDGGLYRVRRTHRPLCVPTGLHIESSGIRIEFSSPLHPASADPSRYGIKTWDLKRTADYGSRHHNERRLEVAEARLLPGGKALFLGIPELAVTRGMEVSFDLQSADGGRVMDRIHNTIHAIPE